MPRLSGGEALSWGGEPIASDGDALFVGDGYGHFRDSRRTTCGVIGGWWVGGARSRALVRHAGTGVRQAQRKRRDAGSGDGLRAGVDMPAPRGLGMPRAARASAHKWVVRGIWRDGLSSVMFSAGSPNGSARIHCRRSLPMSATTVTVTVPIRSIVKHFESLPDPRHTCNRLHLLADGISIAVCGVIVGCSGPSAIERWAKAKKEWLKEVLALPNGIPSRDCIRRILCALKPEAFQTCFQSWMASLLSEDDDKTVAIDGKAIRRSHDRTAGLGPLHMVSAWASEHGLSLGQVATEEKSNEITAIPALIDRIDVKGAIVTIDAMG